MDPETTTFDELTYKVAVLLSKGVKPKDICKLLDQQVSLASIARRKKEAIGGGLLVTSPACNLPLDRIEEIEISIHAPGLRERLEEEQPTDRRHLQRLRILDAGVRPRAEAGSPAWEEHRSAFGRLAARHLEEHVFPHVETMGVTWGGTLLATILGLRQVEQVPEEGRRLLFFPACGTSPDANLRALRSSSHLVGQLDLRLYRIMENPTNFSVAASIPKDFRGRDEQVLQRYFRGLPGYARVMGLDGQPGLLETMDAVMTSVGTSNPADDPWIEGAAEAAGIDAAVLSEHTWGNVGGVFLPRPKIGKHGKTIERVNQRWTGIRLEHYLDCARRAVGRESGGTLLVAIGNKADVTLECLRQGLVSELIIDPVLARGLAKALGWQPEGGAAAPQP